MTENQDQHIEAVQRMQDCIAENLNQPLSLGKLAKAAGYSPWHAARMFKSLTGKTPLDYVRAFRLSKAALSLRDGHGRIIDVALDFCFDSQEGFTRAFSEAFGTTPARYRKQPPPIPLFMPFRIQGAMPGKVNGDAGMEEERNDRKESGTVFVQVVERPARKMLLLRGKEADNYYDYCEERGCDVWGVLCSVKEALYEPVGMWLPENLRKPDTGVYAQGVEVPSSYAGVVPDGYDLIDLPACKLMVFQGPPYMDEHFEEAIGSLWEVMKRYDPVFYGFKWADDDGPRIQLEPQGERGYIEARPVRAV
jgi:AraC family transcriptional regulator